MISFIAYSNTLYFLGVLVESTSAFHIHKDYTVIGIIKSICSENTNRYFELLTLIRDKTKQNKTKQISNSV